MFAFINMQRNANCKRLQFRDQILEAEWPGMKICCSVGKLNCVLGFCLVVLGSGVDFNISRHFVNVIPI